MLPRKYIFPFSKAHADNQGSLIRENGSLGLFIKKSKFRAGCALNVQKLNKAQLLGSAETGALGHLFCSRFAQGPPTRNTKWFVIFKGKRGASKSCRKQGVLE